MSDDPPDSHEPSAPATPDGRAKLFDSIFKKLMMESSPPAIVRFINGLFGKDHPTDSKVHAAPVESVKDDLSKNFTDMVITIGDSDKYVIEAQTGNDNAMAYRILDYSVQQSQVRSGETAYTATLHLPAAVVLYWEPTRNTPDSLTIHVEAQGRAVSPKPPRRPCRLGRAVSSRPPGRLGEPSLPLRSSAASASTAPRRRKNASCWPTR